MTVYVSALSFIEYAAERGILIEEKAAKIAIRNAQDYLDLAYVFSGTAMQQDAAFPRSGLAEYDNTTVPYPVQIATMRIALLVENGVALYEGSSVAPIKKEVVASNRIETEYDTQTNSVGTIQQQQKLVSITKLLSSHGLIEENDTLFRLYGVRG